MSEKCERLSIFAADNRNCLIMDTLEDLIDNCAKMADQGRSDLDVVFIMILCGTIFCI